jgi:tRNA threonylcarbamoyladenosine biosynthesis protein TsaB
MLLLAIDTSGKHGSIALAQCGPEHQCQIIEVVPLEGGTFSAQLVPQIAALLEKHGLSKRNLAAFAVASGPGSFTGLRVGLAAIKALAETLGKPIAAVSLLEAVAAARSEGKVLAALDAGRGEIYAGEYDTGKGVTDFGERLLTREEFLAAADGRFTLTPDHVIAEAGRATGLRIEEVARPGSDAIARLGWTKILSGQTVLPEELEANYIRRSDAEIFAKNGSNPLSLNSNIKEGDGADLKIRSAAPADIPALMALEKQASAGAHWSSAQYQTAFSGESPPRVALVLEEKAGMRGFLIARALGNEWEIENIVIAGSARRRGLGTKLLGEFLKIARSRGAKAVFLEVRESNLAARRLYEKLRFMENGRRKLYYREPDEDAIVCTFHLA